MFLQHYMILSELHPLLQTLCWLQGDSWLAVSSHNVTLPACSIKDPCCHGYLTKLGFRRKTWRHRYCVLKDACMYYYQEVASSTAQGWHGFIL